MQLPRGATVAVADGETLNMFRNAGDEGHPQLTAMPTEVVDGDHKGVSTGHNDSAGNHDPNQAAEDGFAFGVAELLNRQVLTGKVEGLVIVAPPRMLGELRKHYHAKLSAVLLGEIAKELTGRSAGDVEAAIAAA